MKHPTYTATFIPDESMLKEYREWIHPMCRPRRISPKKRVKWRLVKKWFNRYEKDCYCGAIVFFYHADGSNIPCQITNIKIEKAGKHRLNYIISAVPVTLCDLF